MHKHSLETLCQALPNTVQKIKKEIFKLLPSARIAGGSSALSKQPAQYFAQESKVSLNSLGSRRPKPH